MKTTAVSAPGKVLIAGGYLVLDRTYTGLVIGTSSRFYTVIKANGTTKIENASITVKSPQFLESEWTYQLSPSPEHSPNRIELSQPAAEKEGKNKFVQLALEKCIQLAVEMLGFEKVWDELHGGTGIWIVGDNDFYSQRAQLSKRNLPTTTSSLLLLPPFCPSSGTLSSVHKTGLGSSAALITSLVASLLLHLNVVSDPSTITQERELIHNTAQFIHCFAQGKIGSGFDVSSAVYGNQIYKRFSPTVLEPLMKTDSSVALYPTLSSKEAWDCSAKPFVLPPGLKLLLADVDAGSDSPSMAGKVLKWRKDNAAEAEALWTKISNANEAFTSALSTLNALSEELGAEEYETELWALSSVIISTSVPPNPSPNKLLKALEAIREQALKIRASMKVLGDLAGVPIEPAGQTEIIDACMALPGVVGGGVPGAGGYDALWILVISPISNTDAVDTVSQEVENLWLGWDKMSVCPLLSTASPVGGGLSVIGDIEDVKGLPGVVKSTLLGDQYLEI